MHYQARRSSQQWESLIQEQAQSGLSQKQFCLNHDISYASFVKWRQKTKGANNKFLPISTQEVSSQGSLSLTMGWGRFSLSLTL